MNRLQKGGAKIAKNKNYLKANRGGGMNGVKQYFNEVRKISLLEKENNNGKAIKSLTETNLKLVVSIAKKYRWCDLSFLDFARTIA